MGLEACHPVNRVYSARTTDGIKNKPIGELFLTESSGATSFARPVDFEGGRHSEIEMERFCRWLGIGIVVCIVGMFFGESAYAGDLQINIPKRSRLTPVQRLNREGVEAVRKHQYDKAKDLFFRAYVYDPGDPFTLNNLGYIAELEGQVERAQRFYALASGKATEARIDVASSSKLKGESLANMIGGIGDVSMRVNRANVEAVRLLSEGRYREADSVLQQARQLDPKNGFTLNNLGVVEEAQGEYGKALIYYDAAANLRLEDPIVVTMNSAWRGKPLSKMAQESAERLRSRMKTLESTEAQVAVLNLRGVSAVNRNDLQEASEYFAKAYKLDPENAFSINNQGFLAEINGDLESAEDYYREAQGAGGAHSRVGVATRPDAEGMRLFAVADSSEGQVDGAIEADSAARQKNPGPIQLRRRDGTPVTEPSAAPPTNPQTVPPQGPNPPSEGSPPPQ
jgi:Flp pilus assembly protein TadD